MNRLRLAVSLVAVSALLAGTVHFAAGWFPLTGALVLDQEQTANTQVAAPQRSPIKVGGNIQMTKLIHKVEPVYPELAKKARISGNVTLVVTVNEEGQVSDIRISSGHPLLNEAAISAVKQWRYSPTLLNGQPVPVMATVVIGFSSEDQKVSISGVANPLPRMPSVNTPFIQAPRFDGAVDVIQPDGLGGYIVFRATPINEKGTPPSGREPFHAPELALDRERLHTLAEAAWPAGVDKTTPLAYLFFVDEVGAIKNLNRVQGPDIPDVERELARTHVIAPGLLGTTPVRSWCVIEIRLPMDNK